MGGEGEQRVESREQRQVAGGEAWDNDRTKVLVCQGENKKARFYLWQEWREKSNIGCWTIIYAALYKLW
jgi:hypothetical protein